MGEPGAARRWSSRPGSGVEREKWDDRVSLLGGGGGNGMSSSVARGLRDNGGSGGSIGEATTFSQLTTEGIGMGESAVSPRDVRKVSIAVVSDILNDESGWMS